MFKKSFISFASLFIFWIVISGALDLQHIMAGIIITLFTIWFWKELSPRLPSRIFTPIELLLFIRCIIMLAGYVLKSNIDVIKILLFSDLSEGSIFLELEPGIESNWGRVFLASCITITPGTITIDFDPETNVFTVHALTIETGKNLYYWSIITEIKDLETLMNRRKKYAVDNGRIHDSSSNSSTESDHWANRD